MRVEIAKMNASRKEKCVIKLLIRVCAFFVGDRFY